jgi:hypothetical protein
VIDSYDSSNPFKSATQSLTYNGVTYSYGQYDSTKRQSHGDVGTNSGTGSDLRSTYVYGNLSYRGVGPKKHD